MESAGFKEWALVCEALGRGEQSVIVRKGGIAEGREGFSFRHAEFFLLPTFFHEQLAKIRGNAREIPGQIAGEIAIEYFAKLELAVFVDSWEKVSALAPFHILQENAVRERFDYERAPGIHLGLVRVYRLDPVWILADATRFGGCRSWVELPALPDAIRMAPVLNEQEQQQRSVAVKAIVSR